MACLVMWPDSYELGALGVCHLKRVWSRSVNVTRVANSPAHVSEFAADRVLFSGLGLGLEPTIQYLFRERPTYTEFEQWVLALNGGRIDLERIERVNAALLGQPAPESARKIIDEIERMEPVLTSEELAFWDENGYVVVHDAVSKDNLEAAEKALWSHLRMDPANADTWYSGGASGIMVPLYQHPALSAARRSRRLHKAFAQLLGTADLWVTTDRMGFNPPERPGFSFPGPHLHWDTSLVPPIPLGVGGVLYLTDTLPEQGAFTCVPGFHLKIEEWLKNLPPGADPRFQDLTKLGPRAIGGKAGDLVIWRQELPHGSSPNRARHPRLVQYVTMFTAEL